MNLEVLESKLSMWSFFKLNPEVKCSINLTSKPNICGASLMFITLFSIGIVPFCWKLSVGLYFGILADFSSKYCHVYFNII